MMEVIKLEMQPVLLRLGHIGLQLHTMPVVLFVQQMIPEENRHSPDVAGSLLDALSPRSSAARY